MLPCGLGSFLIVGRSEFIPELSPATFSSKLAGRSWRSSDRENFQFRWSRIMAKRLFVTEERAKIDYNFSERTRYLSRSREVRLGEL